MKFTLDTNCVIDLDEARPDAPHVRVLVDAHVEGGADVAIVAIMASEKQKGVAAAAETFDEFERRCAGLGLSALPLLLPPVALDLTYLDRCVWASGDQLKLARDIQAVMFPKIEFDFSEFCRARGIDPRGSLFERPKAAWRNAFCDVCALWSHIVAERDVFVARDADFLSKKSGLIALGARDIASPADAVRMLAKNRSHF